MLSEEVWVLPAVIGSASTLKALSAQVRAAGPSHAVFMNFFTHHCVVSAVGGTWVLLHFIWASGVTDMTRCRPKRLTQCFGFFPGIKQLSNLGPTPNSCKISGFSQACHPIFVQPQTLYSATPCSQYTFEVDLTLRPILISLTCR